MSMTTIEQARNAAPLGVEDLGELMTAVNEVTQRLHRTHEALRAQVTSLQKELADANAQLRRSRSLAALGEMAAGIAHEVRNPLGSILLYVEMLREELDDRPGQADICRKIGEAVEGLDSIVTDVLSFARDTQVRAERIGADDLIDRAVSTCQGLLAKRDVAIRRSVAPDAATLEGDPGLLTQALGNVIRNGIEAMHDAPPDARRLSVDVARGTRRLPDGSRSERIVLGVLDHGPGVPEDVVQRMFNPFFTTRQTGTGLGLAIVHRIVDAHGGEVAVSNVDGAGARFELCLPLKPLAAPCQRSAESGASGGFGGSGGSGACEVTMEFGGMSLSEAVSRRIATEQSG